MAEVILYAHLKTIDGDEVMEYSKEEFEELAKELNFRTVKKHDRTLHFVIDNKHVNIIKFFKDDYFEVID